MKKNQITVKWAWQVLWNTFRYCYNSNRNTAEQERKRDNVARSRDNCCNGNATMRSMLRWATSYCQQYKNTEYCTEVPLCGIYVGSKNKSSSVLIIFLSDCNQIWNFTTHLMKAAHIQFHANPSSGNRADTCRRTDRQMDRRSWRS
jgi:hypothetical protein